MAGALVATPAHAANTVTVKPETFAGGAAARALDISVLGTKLTLGDTVANIVKGVDNSGKTTLLAKAIGTGELSLLGNTSAASALTSDGAVTKPNACSLTIPVADIASVATACGSSSASIKDGLLSALATGTVGDVELSVNNLLHTLGLDSTVEGVGLQVGGLVNTLVGVADIVGIQDTLGIKAGDLLSSVISSIAKTKTLTVKIGDAVSKVSNDANTVVATAHSAAVDVTILPDFGLNVVDQATQAIKFVPLNKPLLEIIISEANATAKYDRLTGKALGDPTFEPGIVTLKGYAVQLLTGKDTLRVSTGQDITLLAGTPLESRIVLGAGKIVDDGVFGKKAVADGVAVELLKGISGGIILNLSHAEAGAISNLPQTKVLDTPSLDIARGTSLPRTGAETALPLAFAGMAIAIVAVRRYRMVAATK